jgi:outer membrane murein-binding lipoprotein Lpp
MAEKRSVMSQLTSVGEGALGRLAQYPVTQKAVESAVQVKERVEKLVGSVGELDGRVSKLEKRVAALEKQKRAAAKKSPDASKTPD